MPVLHSRIIGEGTPLVILHGFLGMSDNWKTLGNRYAEEGYQVHLVDQRNHGRSFHSEDFDYTYLSDDLLAYCDYHHLDTILLLGHSMGGKTAMQFATEHPERMLKLLVADISPKYYPPHHQTIVDALAKLDFSVLTSRKEVDNTLADDLPETGIRQFLLKNLYWKEPKTLALRCNIDILKNRMEEIGDHIDTTAHFDGPTLFLRGDRSEYIQPADIPEIQRHFPLAEIATIVNAGHWLHAENPNQFFEKSLLFLNS
ncbi:MAG: alpha/beta fold hydrolase [Bacteroidota bacterium]